MNNTEEHKDEFCEARKIRSGFQRQQCHGTSFELLFLYLKYPQQFTEIKGNFFFLYAIKIALHCLIFLQISNRKKNSSTART